MRSSPPTRCSPSAFTLMELMVVIALVAILAAAIVPEMRGCLEDAVLKASARRVIDLCSLANSRAVAQGRVHRIRFDPTSRQLQVEMQQGRSSSSENFRPIRDLGESETRIDPRIQLDIRTSAADSTEGDEAAAPSRTEGALSFYPDGTADPGDIELVDRAGVKLALRLNPVTARFRKVERTPR